MDRLRLVAITMPECTPMTRTLTFVVAGCLILAGCSSDGDSTSATTNDTTATTTAATEPPPTEPAPTEPPATEPSLEKFETLAPGPYQVGVTTVTITDPVRDPPLTTEVWFPVTDAGGSAPYQYTLFPGAFYESPTALDTGVARISPDGPFPLVVFSHGAPGVRFLYSTFGEALASYGYIVAAPDHTGNTVFDLFADTRDDRAVVAVNRPLDVQAVITAMTTPTDPQTADLASAVDPDRIAVAGQSAGGYTTYATVSGVTNEVATVDADDRVDAIITLAPASAGITDQAFTSIDVPALVIGGSGDEVTPIDPNVTRPWEWSGSAPHYRADLVDAEHYSFADFCQYQQFLPTLPEIPQLILDTVDEFAEGCVPGVMGSDRVHLLTNTFAVAFLESVFRGGDMIDGTAVAIPDDVIFMTK
jgi:predicted dienelactone hydrolase